jgi:hypothetical protein
MSDLSIPDLILEAEPVNISPKSRIVTMLRSIINQYGDNYEYFVKSLPTAILVIPLALFFLSPTASRGIYLFGAIFTVIVGILFTSNSGEHFTSNSLSFHGLALGYVVGYLFMENIMLEKPGSMLSTGVMGMILAVLLSISLFNGDIIYKEMLHVGIGLFLGILIGIFFYYAEFKTLESTSDKATELVKKEVEEKKNII